VSSRFTVVRSEPLILGDLGVMAVQVLSRTGAKSAR